MPRNVEIKARIDSVEALVPKATAIATEGPTDIAQDDTFFHCDTGRLKLRMFTPDAGELIFYRRADARGPKESFYVRTPTADPAGLRDALSLACGLAGRVRKQRTLFISGRTRIHLDRVEGLGDFIELEVVLDEDEPIDVGVKQARALMALLGIATDRLVETAYVDLLGHAAR